MDASHIIEVIKRRQAKFEQRASSRSSLHSNEADRIDLAIAEEYDSLMAEIETLGVRPTHASKGTVRAEQGRQLASHAAAASNHEPGSRTDDFVLGDQGQSGG
jgi:hypothetical protein